MVSDYRYSVHFEDGRRVTTNYKALALLSHAKPTAGSGVKASLLGTTRRSNGSRQVTYNKHPLYTYTLDKKAGQTKGEDILAFGAKWYAVSATGTAVKASTTPTTTTTTCRYPPC